MRYRIEFINDKGHIAAIQEADNIIKAIQQAAKSISEDPEISRVTKQSDLLTQYVVEAMPIYFSPSRYNRNDQT